MLLTLASPRETIIYDVRQLEPEALREWLAREVLTRPLLIHNSAFDLSWLFYLAGAACPLVWDTLLAEQLLHAGLTLGHRLADLCQRYLGQTLDKELQTSFSLEGELLPAQLEYAARDVQGLFAIREQQAARIAQEGLLVPWTIEQAATPVFAAMMACGIGLNAERLGLIVAGHQRDLEAATLEIVDVLQLPWATRELRRIDDMRHELRRWLDQLETVRQEAEQGWQLHMAPGASPPPFFAAGRFDDQTRHKESGEPLGLRRFRAMRERDWRQRNPRPEKPPEGVKLINIGSRDQVLPALADLGIDLPDFTLESIETALLGVKLADDQRRILQALKRHKAAKKQVEAFGDKLLEKRRGDGKLHAEFRQYGAASGRPSASSPNVLQIPHGAHRSAFIPDVGHVFIICDYSQIELRILAELSADPGMLAVFAAGEDPHTDTARVVFRLEEVKKEQRDAAKVVNFGISYGMEAAGFRAAMIENGVVYSYPQAKKIVKDWRQARAVAWAALERWRDTAVRERRISDGFGRARWFPQDYDESALRREAGNHVIQATNAGITKLAMALIQPQLLQLKGTIVLNVYDELVAQVPAACAQRAADIVQEGMRRAALTVLKQVPVEVDCCISPSWSEDDAIEEHAHGK